MGKFSKLLVASRTQERKSPFGKKGLFRLIGRFSESQLHACEELYARDRIVVIQLVLLIGHIVQ